MANASPGSTCHLALEDGTVFTGSAFGAGGTQTGEVVFNTSMTGYQEILTDPSYCGQIIAMTYPHIGNYGVNECDAESSRIHARGLVVRELAKAPSNYRATLSLDDYLTEQGVIGIQGIDTRSLTKRLRVQGTMRAVITSEIDDLTECVRLARAASSMTGADLVQEVASTECSVWEEGFDSPFTPARIKEGSGPVTPKRVVAIDCGMKRNILRHLVDVGCSVRVVPPTMSAKEILSTSPDGVFVSNGPGDPAAVAYTIATLKSLLGKVPIFGICLGHQLLALALGATSYKLKFGHRGANQPVQNLGTGKVEITSQNHGFAVEIGSLEQVGGLVTHVNLNDGTLEGFVHHKMPIMAVQYHPEASPGPHDAGYLFDQFRVMMDSPRVESRNGSKLLRPVPTASGTCPRS